MKKNILFICSLLLSKSYIISSTNQHKSLKNVLSTLDPQKTYLLLPSIIISNNFSTNELNQRLQTYPNTSVEYVNGKLRRSDESIQYFVQQQNLEEGILYEEDRDAGCLKRGSSFGERPGVEIVEAKIIQRGQES